MTLQDDINNIYTLEAAQNIFGRDSNVNTFGNFSGDNRAFINAAPLMVSVIRRLELERKKLITKNQNQARALKGATTHIANLMRRSK